MVEHFGLATIATFGQGRNGGFVVRAAFAAALLGVSSFWKWHCTLS